MKLYDWSLDGVFHIVSTTYPPLIFQDAHVKSVKHRGLVRNILWIEIFVFVLHARRKGHKYLNELMCKYWPTAV